MKKAYYALIHAPEGDTAWGVTFPDLPGCTSAGDSFEDAVEQAEEALSGHVAAMVADGDIVPPPRSYADLAADAEVQADIAEGSILQRVPFRQVGARTRVNIMIDAGLLADTDSAAEAVGKTRSGYIEDALKARLSHAA